jgi:hypothetical protein
MDPLIQFANEWFEVILLVILIYIAGCLTNIVHHVRLLNVRYCHVHFGDDLWQ